jgi:hypothetical protein
MCRWTCFCYLKRKVLLIHAASSVKSFYPPRPSVTLQEVSTKTRPVKSVKHNARIIRILHQTTARPPEDHACPICLRTKEALVSPKKPNKSVWSLDHHHKGGYFRGWLCHRCNRGVGLVGDSVENANRLVDYLK